MLGVNPMSPEGVVYRTPSQPGNSRMSSRRPSRDVSRAASTNVGGFSEGVGEDPLSERPFGVPSPGLPYIEPSAPPKLRQLSPSVLAVLLEDLIEYNGINFRTVPVRTFREKYIGLFFGVAKSERCRRFLQYLKAFYVVVSHKFECVLVDCSQTEEEYRIHAQMTLLPTYPQGDYRGLLLRKHFEVNEVPQLIILDPNGMVVTTEGVRHVEEDQMALAFPWCDPIIDTIWGQKGQGQLRHILEQLDLPSINGMDAGDHDVVGLLFGEPWCPEANEIVKRISYLRESRRQRLLFQWQAENGDFENTKDFPEEHVAFYFIHADPIDKYRDFPGFEMPFPTLYLTDPELREALYNYMGIEDIPALVIAAPDEGWVLRDGQGWLKRDPTGILFPWKHHVTTNDLMTMDDDEDVLDSISSLLQPLDEDNLVTAMCRGPVFVAFLSQVGHKRSEVLQLIRSAVASFLSAPPPMQEEEEASASPPFSDEGNEETKMINFRGVSIDLEPAAFVEGTGDEERQVPQIRAPKEHAHPQGPRKDSLTRHLQFIVDRRARRKIRGNGAHSNRGSEEMPSPRLGSDPDCLVIRRSSRLLLEPERVLWRANKLGADREILSQGTAPWNANEGPKSQAARLGEGGMTFYYSVAGDRASHLLSQFCCHNAKPLREHHIWEEAHRFTEGSMGVNQDIGERMREFSQPNNNTKVLEAARASMGGMVSTLSQGNMSAAAPSIGADVSRQPSLDGEGSAFEAVNSVTRKQAKATYQPNTRFSAWQSQTEALLGDGNSSLGSAIILDLPRGNYYVCGNIIDRDVLLRFLDNWQRGTLDPFEISLLNPEEMIKDEEQEVLKQLAAGTHPKYLPTELSVPRPNPMPGIVIWVPTLQHATCGHQVHDLYKAFLNFAVRRCPAEDSSTLWKDPGIALADDDLNGLLNLSQGELLTPMIEKMWIFGLEDCEEASLEEGFGNWAAPSSDFLATLSSYVKNTSKKQTMDEIRDVRKIMDKERHTSGSIRSDALGYTPGTPGSETRERQERSSYLDVLAGRPLLFDEALRQLRLKDSLRPHSVTGHYNLTMRTASTRQELFRMMLEELGYHANIQCPPPPLFILFVGDLPPEGSVPWPSCLKSANMQVVGQVPSLSIQRQISPLIKGMEFERWMRNCMDPTMTASLMRGNSVPWL